MNILQTLPYTVMPIERTQEQRDKTRQKLSDYLQRNPLLARNIRQRKRAEHSLSMAAHASGLYFSRWENPNTGKWVYVVTDKQSVDSRAYFEYILRTESVHQSLNYWTK